MANISTNSGILPLFIYRYSQIFPLLFAVPFGALLMFSPLSLITSFSRSSVMSGIRVLISSLFMFAPFSNALIMGVASPCFDSFTTLPVKNGYNKSRDRYKMYRFRLKLLNLGIRKAPRKECLYTIHLYMQN